MGDDADHERVEDEEGDAEEVHLGEVGEAGGEAEARDAAGDHDDDSARGEEHAESGDEGRHVDPGDERRVDEAEDRADRQGEQDRERPWHAGVHRDADRHASDGEDGPDGQIEAAADEDEGRRAAPMK